MRRWWAVAVLSLGACGHDASGDPMLLVPEDVEFGWDASFNLRGDGKALLVPIDMMVYTPAGDPLDGVPLVLTGSSGAALLRPEAVLAGGADEPRDVVWDAWRDRYFTLASEPVAVLEVETDGTGVAHAWAFVDRLATDEAGFAPAQVSVALGDTEDSFLLVPR